MATSVPNVSDSIIRKIQLLFQMAQRKTNNDGTSNEAEAMAAMAKAQELLAQYNLDLNVVQEARVEGGTAQAVPEKRERQQFSRSAMYRWQQRLARAICEANFCWYWTVDTLDNKQVSGGSVRTFAHNRHVKRHVILGRQGNAKVAEMMYEYLADTIERVIPYQGRERLSRSANSWREGCAERLIERIEEKARKMKEVPKPVAGAPVSGVVAMTVRDVHEAEFAANYDAQWGSGAYAKKKQRDAENSLRWKQEAEERAELMKLERQAETPEMRAKREAREDKEAEQQRKSNERYWHRQDQKEERERMRRDVHAYYQGQDRADDIGLDQQIGEGKEQGKLK